MRALRRLPVVWLACAVACVPGASELHAMDLIEVFNADPASADTKTIEFGTAAATPLMGKGWARALEREKGATFSWAVGVRSELQLYAARPEARVLVASVRPFLFASAPRQRIELRLNGRSLGAQDLAPERQELRW